MKRTWTSIGVVLSLVLAACGPGPATVSPTPTAPAGATPTETAAEEPVAGGELVYIVSAEPPTLDAHQSTTFATLMPVSPQYSLLYRLDPADNVSEIIPDVAADLPEVSADGLTYTVRLRENVMFHDGQQLTSADVKATYDKLRDPPEGTASPRAGVYAVIDTIETPDDYTVEFRLTRPSASFLASLASPWNYLYSAAKLAEDPEFYETNVVGTGPFVFEEYVQGESWSATKNPDYFIADRPYLDRIQAVFIGDSNRQTQAIRAEQAFIEFRGFTPTQRDEIVAAMGDRIVVQESDWVCVNYIAFNTTKAPFNDERVRRALTLAIDRWSGGEALGRQTIVKYVGGLMRPAGPFATPESELEQIPGFYRDNARAVEEARALLAEAGVSDLSFAFHNRNITTPYEPVALFIINEWAKIGVTATHEVKETAAYIADLRAANFDVGLDFNCDYFDEPDLQLAKFFSASGRGANLNLSHYDDSELDAMIDAQARETDPQQRLELIQEIERYAIGEKVYMVPVLWWYRIIPHNARVRGYVIGSNHYTTMDMANIWLAPE